MIRMANLDNYEPRIQKHGCWSWDSNTVEVWHNDDEKKITVMKKVQNVR